MADVIGGAAITIGFGGIFFHACGFKSIGIPMMAIGAVLFVIALLISKD